MADQQVGVCARLRVHRKISRGPCSRVYVGEICATGEPVALKAYEVSARGKREREQELQVLRVIEERMCPFVVRPKLYVQQPFIGVEFCARGDLVALMEHGSPSLRQIRGIAKEIIEGIRFLHENLVIHGDIKPENIGIAEDGHIRIFDFGLATIVQADEEGKLCKVVSPYGTTAYSRPEKLQGKPYGFEVDLWGFAVVLFELAHDELPWLGSTPDETCSLICEAPLCIPGDEETVAEDEELDNEEEACNDLLHEMLAFKDPEERLGYHEGWREVLAHPFLLDEDLCKIFLPF